MNFLANLFKVQRFKSLDWRLRLAISGAEAGKIVLSNQPSGRLRHAHNIERPNHPPDLATL
jgi:hypothetical protein